MGIYQDCVDYDRECRDFDNERFSDTPAFNEDFMVPRNAQGCRACQFAGKFEAMGALSTAKVIQKGFCGCGDGI